jgi:hypothetical protein
MTDQEVAANSDVSDDTDEAAQNLQTVDDTQGLDPDDQLGQTSDEEAAGQGEDGEGDPPADEFEDLEWEDGKTYKVPKAVAPALLRTADYQRKTAEVAREREQVAAEQETFHEVLQAHDAFQKEFTRLNVIDYQIAHLKSLDIEKIAAEEGEEEANRIDRRLRRLEGERAAVAQDINAKNGQRLTAQQAEWAKAQERAGAILQKADPEVGWTHKGGVTPEVKAKLEKTGERFGFSLQELGRVVDPRYFKVLHLASIGLELLDKQRAALKTGAKPAGVKPSPATSLSKSGRSAAANSEPRDSDSPEEWDRKRKAQIRSQNRSERRRLGI